MSKPRFDQADAISSALQPLTAMSAEDFRDWFVDGFRAMGRDDAQARPFGDLRLAYSLPESISDVLAAAYQDLVEKTSIGVANSFAAGLEAAFRSLSLRSAQDRLGLVEIMRVAAKIGYHRLLSLIAAKFFRQGDSPDEVLARARSVALDAAIELSATAPNPALCLSDIIHSGLFRPSAARSLLLALCSVEPTELLGHLVQLEAPLVAMYGSAAEWTDEDMWRKRAVLIADLLRFSPYSVLLAVVDHSLRDRDWPLAWFADVVMSPRRFAELAEGECERLRRLFDAIPDYAVESAPSDGSRMPDDAPPLSESRRITDILLSDDPDPLQEREALFFVVARLCPGNARPAQIGASLRDAIMDDSAFEEAA